jgi:hypothetical protein
MADDAEEGAEGAEGRGLHDKNKGAQGVGVSFADRRNRRRLEEYYRKSGHTPAPLRGNVGKGQAKEARRHRGSVDQKR